jgi:tRNA wybutosine-synthesizing protein 4
MLTVKVVVHKATAQYMNFQSKNFSYSTTTFGKFIDQVESGEKLYLRSLSAEKPADLPADISRDFPSIANDFRLPTELALVTQNAHSCPLRISGPVIMWLHYDVNSHLVFVVSADIFQVMANVLCQIKGLKRLLLFPPADVKYLGFEAGASSSSINFFDSQSPIPGNTHPHEALLEPGDVLFLPPFWLHTASPTSGMSVAVNVFFRNLRSGYAAGKDVYGNRDLQAYEKGRQDIAKIIKSFDSLPADVQRFYLPRLAKEFEEKAC